MFNQLKSALQKKKMLLEDQMKKQQNNQQIEEKSVQAQQQKVQAKQKSKLFTDALKDLEKSQKTSNQSNFILPPPPPALNLPLPPLNLDLPLPPVLDLPMPTQILTPPNPNLLSSINSTIPESPISQSHELQSSNPNQMKEKHQNYQNSQNTKEENLPKPNQSQSKIPEIMPVVTQWDGITKKKKKSSIENTPLSTQILKKDVSSFLKQQFLKQANILNLIDFKVEQKNVSFNYPSIEHKHRDIEPIDTVYMDADKLDLVSCFMMKNINAIKPHSQLRQNFIHRMKQYDWTQDKSKFKLMLKEAELIPSVDFKEPNFVQIKNTLRKAENLEIAYAKQTQFQKCLEIKNMKLKILNDLQKYCQNPQNNKNLLPQIQQHVKELKDYN